MPAQILRWLIGLTLNCVNTGNVSVLALSQFLHDPFNGFASFFETVFDWMITNCYRDDFLCLISTVSFVYAVTRLFFLQVYVIGGEGILEELQLAGYKGLGGPVSPPNIRN